MASSKLGITLKSRFATASNISRINGAAGTINYNYAFENIVTASPAFVDQVSAYANATSNSVSTAGTNMVIGNTGVVSISIKTTSLPTLTAPTGWTLITSRANASNSLSVYAYAKVLDSNDFGSSLVWSYTGTAQQFSIAMAAYAALPISPFDTVAGLATNGDTTSSTSVGFASLTATSPNVLIVGVGGNRGASNGANQFSAPSGYTLRSNAYSSATSLDIGSFVFDGNGALGSTTTGALTGTQAVSGYSITALFALKPVTSNVYPPAQGAQPAPIQLTFEEGSNGSAITASGEVTLVAGTPVYSTAAKIHGVLGARSTADGITRITVNQSYLTSEAHTGSMYIRPNTVPATSYLLQLTKAGSNNHLAHIRMNSNGHFDVATGTPSVVATSTLSWVQTTAYRLDWQWTAGASAVLTVRIFAGANLEGTVPDDTMTANFSGLTGNLGTFWFCPSWVNSGTSYPQVDFDTIRVWSGTASWPAPFNPSASSATVTHTWAGGPISTGFTVVSKISGGSSIQMKVSTASDMSAIVATVGSQTPDANGYVRHTATGLTAATQYYYQMYDASTLTLIGSIGKAKTLPVTGSAQNFKFAIGSCTSTNATQSAALDSIRTWAPDFMVHLGDFHYKGSSSTDPNVHAQNFADQIAGAAGLKTLVRDVPMYYCRSDHEAGPDNGDSNNTYTAANITAYQTVVPYNTLADSRSPKVGLYQTWTAGRIRFILLDVRNTDRSPGANTDDSSKTMLGATQLAWLYAQLSQPEPIKVILSDVGWLGPASLTNGPDKWWAYSTERTAIGNYITTNRIRAVLVHGDTHSLMADDGTNNTGVNGTGNFPVVCASPFAQVGGGRNTSIPQQLYDTGSSTQASQYQRFTVTDTGSNLQIYASGWDALAGVERTALTMNFDMTNSIYGQGTYGGDIYPGAAGLTFKVWNGTTELATTSITVWNGSVENAASIASVV